MKVLIFGVEYYNKNYDLEYVYDADEFYEKILSKKYDVLIVNFDLFEYVSEIKKFFEGKIIFISAFIDELIYKKSLEMGDFCYSFDEMWKLNYRLLYLRKHILGLNSMIFKYGSLIFDLKRKVLYKNNEEIFLSPAEKEILKLLILNKNQYLSKDFILNNCEYIESENSIKVLISKLRHLGFDIINQKNLGYKLKEKK